MAGPAVDEAAEALLKEMARRVARAETDLNRHKKRIASCYKFALPWRHGFDQNEPVDQLDDIFDDTAMTVVEDFAADMLNTFTPMKNDWIEFDPVAALPSDVRRQLADQLKERQAILFADMASSNVYQALQESYLDLSVGTMALTAQDIGIAEPIHCQAIPMTELLIDRGPYGYVDGKWRKRRRRCEDIRVLWPRARPPSEAGWGSDPTKEHDVIDGLWRDWSIAGDEVHQYVVQIDGKLAYAETYTGAGSCPMIVARWSRDSTTAWGIGPLYRSMPTVKSLNHMHYGILKNFDQINEPAVSYVNDGVMNVDNGVEPGDWIPRALGSDPPTVIESKARPDLSWMQAEELRSAIRRAHYQDRPDQRGKTPPSATQWADEAAERQRRMGTPATNLVQELQYAIVRRFIYLLTKRGTLEPLELNGQQVSMLDGRFVAMTPTSPLLRAQEQEELIRFVRTVELIVAQYGPQIAAVVTDIFKFAESVARILGTQYVIRKESEIKAAIEQLLPVLKAASGGGQPTAAAALVGPNG